MTNLWQNKTLLQKNRIMSKFRLKEKEQTDEEEHLSTNRISKRMAPRSESSKLGPE